MKKSPDSPKKPTKKAASKKVAPVLGEAQALRPVAAPAGAARILFVTDKLAEWESLRRALSEQYEIEVAQEGAAALAAARLRSPDLIVSDVMTDSLIGQALNGLGLLTALRADEALREVPVILLDTQGGEALEVEAFAAGADDYLNKPFSVEKLLARMQPHLRAARSNRVALSQLRDSVTQLRASERFLQSLIDALGAHIAVLDSEGKILAVNAAWRRFAEANNYGGPGCNVGANYLSVCEASGFTGACTESRHAAAGIRAVATGQQDYFVMDYPCHAPQERRWFQMTVTRFTGPGPLRLVVAHENITERELIREQLRDRVAELQTLIDAMPVGVLIANDPSANQLAANAYLAERMGVAPGDNIALSAPDAERANLIATQQGREVGDDQLPIRQAITRGSAVREVEFETENAAHRRVSWLGSAAPLFDAAGAVRGAVGVFLDITERRNTERVLRENEERLRLATTAAGLGPWERNFVTRRLIASDQLKAIYGFAPEAEFLSQSEWEQLLHPDDRARVTDALRQALAGEGEYEVEYRIRRADGAWRWVQSRGRVLRDDYGRPTRMLGVAMDITERKQAEEALREGERKLRMALDAAQLGIWEWHQDGSRTTSDNYAEVVGASPPTQAEFLAMVHPDDRVELLARAAQVQSEGGLYQHEYRVLLPDGSERWLAGYGRFVPGEGSQPERMIGVVMNITARKRAEEALRASQSLNEDILDSMSAHISVLDKDGTIKFVNESWRKFAVENGADQTLRGVGVGANYLKTYGTPESENVAEANAIKQGLRQILDGTRTFFSLEYPCHSPTTERWFLLTATPLTRAGGGAVVAHQNITERRKAERALREADLRFRNMADSAAVLIWQTDPSGVTFVNRHYLEFFGVTFDAIKGVGWADFLHPDDAAGYVAAYQTAYAQQQGYAYQCRFRRHDGEYRWLQNIGTPHFSAAGDFLGLIGNSTDVTEIKQAEEALRTSEARYRQLADAMPQLVWTCGPDGVVDYYNSRLADYLAVERTADSGWQWEPLIHPHDMAATLDRWRQSLATGEPYECEHRLQMHDGRYCWHLSRARADYDSGGRIVKWYGTATDIDSNKRIELNAQFLVALDAELNRLVLAEEIEQATLNRVGAYLDVDRCYFILSRLPHVVVRHQWLRRGPSLIGAYDLSQFFSQEAIRDLASGAQMVIQDVMRDPRTLAGAAQYVPLEIGAFVTTPVNFRNQWVGALAVTDAAPRHWQASELQLLREVATRVWPLLERARAVMAVRESQENLQAALEGGQMGVWAWDPLANTSTRDRRVLELFGADPDCVAGDSATIFEHIHPDDLPTVLARLNEAQKPGSQYDAEFRVLLPDGRVRWLAGKGRGRFDANGRATLVYGVNYDVTERKQAEADTRFLADLTETIRRAETVDALFGEVADLTGNYFGATRCYLTELCEVESRLTIHNDYHGLLPSRAGSYPLSEYAAQVRQFFAERRPLVIADVKTDPRRAEQYEQTYAPQGIRSLLAVPCLRDGKVMAALSVFADRPRQWEPRQVALLETIAERAWLAVEKLRLNALLQRQGQLIELSHESVLVWDFDTGGILDCNRGCEELYGHKREDIFGRSAHEVLGTVFPGTVEEMHELLVRHNSWRGELRHRTRDGREITVESRWQLFASGVQRVVLEVNRDITNRKRQEAALAESEARFRQMADVVPQFIWVASADGTKIEFINDVWLRYTGLSLEESLLNRQQAIHPDDLPRVNEQWGRTSMAGEPFEAEMRMRRADGEYRWFLARSVPRRDATGRIVNWFGTSTDIHGQKQSELDTRMLAALSERLRVGEDATELMREVAATLGRHLSVDHCFFTSVDLSRDRVTVHPGYGGHRRAGAMPAGEYPFSPLSPVTRGAAGAGETLLVADTAGDARTAGVAAYQRMGLGAFITAPRLRDGQLVAGLTVSAVAPRKWTEHEAALVELVAERSWLALEKLQAEHERALLFATEQAARQSAEEATRLKDEFLATVSHELRAPLNAISGWTNLLRGGQLNPAATERAMETIARNAAAQGRLIEDLLDVSRIVTGKMKMEMTRVDLGQIIEAALDTVRPSAQVKQIALQLWLTGATETVFASQPLELGAAHAEESTPFANIFIQGDAARLQQAIWNLLSNAVKFTPEGGRVTVTVNLFAGPVAGGEPVAGGAHGARGGTAGSQEGQRKFVEISVSDTGRGIAPEFLAYVFDRFRQADSTVSHKIGGLGLGLSIVRHIVEASGGEVAAFSAGENQGATFTLRLPLSAASSAKDVAPVPAPIAIELPERVAARLRGLRVLVVEGNAADSEMLSAMLARYVASVVISATAAEASQRLTEEAFDVLLSDTGIQDGDGYELIRRIREGEAETEGGTHLPSIALTGKARRTDRVRALSAGFDEYIAKPVDPTELALVMVGLVERYGRS